MYKFVEDLPVETFFNEDMGLTHLHWEEIANNKEKINLSPDVLKYVELENSGVLKNICVFSDSGELVGYIVALVTPHLHYMEDLFGYIDVIYVHPKHRNSSVGLRLIDQMETKLRSMGVSVVTYHVKPAHPAISRILERKGYGHMETILGKCIKE